MTSEKLNIEDLSKEIIYHKRQMSSCHEGALEFHQTCIIKLQQRIKDQLGYTPHIYEAEGNQVRVW
jgi:hypothetical protein